MGSRCLGKHRAELFILAWELRAGVLSTVLLEP